MMAEIEAGHIGVVIVKDMSRFGRDYLQVGYYTEMFFPERGIRFIAVVNDVDSKKPSSSNDFLPFLNVMNENLSLRRVTIQQHQQIALGIEIGDFFFG